MGFYCDPQDEEDDIRRVSCSRETTENLVTKLDAPRLVHETNENLHATLGADVTLNTP